MLKLAANKYKCKHKLISKAKQQNLSFKQMQKQDMFKLTEVTESFPWS